MLLELNEKSKKKGEHTKFISRSLKELPLSFRAILNSPHSPYEYTEHTKFILRSLKGFPSRATLNLTYLPCEYIKFILRSLKEFPFRATLNLTYPTNFYFNLIIQKL